MSATSAQLSKLGFTPSAAVPASEYANRLAALKKKMAERDIDTLLLLNPTSTCYVSGYQTLACMMYQCLAISHDKEPAMIVWELEHPGVLLTSNVKDANLYRTGENRFQATYRMLADRKMLEGVIGVEKDGMYFSPSDYEQMCLAFDGCRLVDGSGLVRELQRVKSTVEIGLLRQAARYTEAGMEAAIKAIAEGRLDQDVAAAGYHAMITAGSEMPTCAPIVTSGRRSGIPHTTHSRIRLTNGDAVFIELGGCHERYTAPLMRTVFMGEPDAGARDLAAATLQTLAAVLETVKPGVTGHEVAARCAPLLPLNEADIVFHHTYGYSVGLGFSPLWSDDGNLTLTKANRIPLEPGMVFHTTISPRRFGRYGCGISETFVVTDRGSEALTKFSREYLSV